jgi:hypothetical protein
MQLSLQSRQPTSARVGSRGFAFLIVFALAFIGFGLFALGAGLEEWSGGDANEAAIPLLLGASFTLVGVGIIAFARKARGAARQLEARKARHPDAPWLWNEDWSGGRLCSSTRARMTFAWLFALVWNGVAIPIAVIAPGEIFDEGNHAAAICLLFPLVGAGLLVWAVRETLRWRRFGESLFEMSQLPGVLGGEVAGVLHVREGLGDGALSARLSCIRRYVTGSGKNRSTHEDIFWSDEQNLPAMALRRGPNGHALDLRFAVPYDAKPSDPEPSDDYILWRLEVTASLPGVDYAAQFDVPVFETAESQRERTAEVLSREAVRGADLSMGVSASSIRVEHGSQGGVEIHFPAGRHKGAAFLVTPFGLVFGGVTIVLFAQSAPVFFALVFGAFSALILYAALALWAGSTRVIARGDGVEVRHLLLGIGRTRFFSVDSIAGVALEVGMRSGRTIYWDLQLRRKGAPLGSRSSRRGQRIGGRIRDKAEAERLAEQIRRALGL